MLRIIKRFICFIRGHEYQMVWRYKTYYACSNGYCSRNQQRFRYIERGKCKAKYGKCERCGKKINLAKAERLGIYHPLNRAHFNNIKSLL